jgi:hypothetical protein
MQSDRAVFLPPELPTSGPVMLWTTKKFLHPPPPPPKPLFATVRLQDPVNQKPFVSNLVWLQIIRLAEAWRKSVISETAWFIFLSAELPAMQVNRIFLPRSSCAGSGSLRDRHSPGQIQKLYLALLLPVPVNTRKDILYQNICASTTILEFLLISLHNLLLDSNC